MAENTEFFCHAVANYIHKRISIPCEYVTGILWQERERLFDIGKIQILWLCGLPYVDKADGANCANMELLVVPIPSGARYQGRPVYYSDIVVRRESRIQSFAGLRGGTWAYNEPRSHSGYNVVRSYLAKFSETSGFFGRVVESGAHQASLHMVMNALVDAAAIDSTVLEWIVARRPEIRKKIRVIETLGPSPIPPWVISTRLATNVRQDLRDLLLQMHQDSAGRFILAGGRIAQFAVSEDEDYDPIRTMALAAEQVFLSL